MGYSQLQTTDDSEKFQNKKKKKKKRHTNEEEASVTKVKNFVPSLLRVLGF